MKKLAIVIVLAAAIGGVFLLVNSGGKKDGQATASAVGADGKVKLPEKRIHIEEPKTFLESQFVANLRRAMATKDAALIEKAFDELVAYILEHPELTEEYLEALRTEPEEHLLRGIAKAMQQSEALMENEAFLKSVMDIAKQQGFEQHQHIMLDTLAQAAYIKPDLFSSIKNMSEALDQPTQVRASAIAVYADWMRRFPEQSAMMITELGMALQNTNDENVRALSVQLLALHRDKLPRDIQMALVERLKVEPQPAGRNLISTALSAAPPEIRAQALGYLQSLYSSQTDPVSQRLTIAQMVMLSPNEARPLLEQLAAGSSDLAEDARQYLALVDGGTATPEVIMNSIVILAANDPDHEHSEGCKH